MKPALFVKEPATVEAQLAKLEHRGCVIEDRTYAKHILEKINYYRLVNYFAVFLDSGGRGKRYRDGTSFNKVLKLYEFDRRLRGHLLIFLEEIEIFMRAVISNYHALKYGALGYINESTFSPGRNHSRFISRIERLVETNTDLGFVSHHNRKYAGAFPLWVMMELFSFGMLSYFFADMHKQDKKEIAEKHMGGQFSARHIESWLESLAELRNHCAHYNRLYGNKIEPVPKVLESANYKMDGSLFSFIYIMKLINRYGSDITPLLGALIEEYSDAVDLKVLGFPEKWEEILT
ncbi:MAG: Abi family protein [Oscillospiraceae bacterium]|jgi:abortive infection bacteriophage resistance protein|nr:Abi family protein [Oscillospiraceae bacterium]